MRTCITMLLLVAIATPLAALEAECPDTMKIVDCWTEVRKAVKVGSLDNAETALKSKTTSPDTFGSPIASTLKNFLPFFGSMIEFESISDDGKAITFNLNPGSERLQIQSVVREPELFSKLGDHFSDDIQQDTRTETLEELQNGLDDFSDVSAVVTYNFLTAEMGRSMEVTRNRWLFERLYEALGAQADTSEARAANTAFNQEIVQLNRDLGITENSPLSSITPENRRDDFRKTLIEAARALAELDLSVDKEFAAMVDMVNNQNQFYITAAEQIRDDLIGPDEFNVKIVYERGFGSLGGLKKRMKNQNCWTSWVAGCLSDYQDAITDWKALKNGHRLSFSAEYTDRERHRVSLPDDGLSLDETAGNSLVAEFAYGRYLSFNVDGQQSTRIDLSASYEDVSDDPERRDRGVASLTLTQRINDDLSIPIALVYANHSKFKGEADKDLSAHFGLSYKLARKQED